MSKVSLDFFQTGLNNKIKKICNNIKPNDELEVSFGSARKPINLKKFHDLLKYINFKSQSGLKSETQTTLDIIYNHDQKTNSSYRLTINGIEQINDLIQTNSLLKNNTLFSKQVRLFINRDNENIILINKIKSPDKFIALEEYEMRIKLSEEKSDIEQSILDDLLRLDDDEKYHIGFRFKRRASLIIEDNSDYIIRIDLTDVKSSKILSSLIDVNSKYELEIDVTFKKHTSDTKVFDKLASYMLNLEQFLQGSFTLVTNTETINVIKNLNNLAYEDPHDIYKDLPAMQSASVEIHHILDYIPGNYTATDKADGERYFLMINDGQAYLISNNLEVKKIKSSMPKEYNLTVLDGEYLFIPRYNKFLFLTFDILFFQGKDVRSEELLKNRLLLVVKVLKDIFNVDLEIGIYTNEYNSDNMYEFHKSNIKKHLNQLNKHLKDAVDNQVVNGKYFIFPMTVGVQNDIYRLTALLYESYTLDTSLACPYMLDGVIYTPINQKYTRSQRETKFKILKWKPDTKNSIDFYVQFERNPDTKKILTVYDRTSETSLEDYIDQKKTEHVDFNDMRDYKVKGTVYQILNLYVGMMKNNQEIPIPFQKENDLNQAFIYLQDGYPRDIEGEIIQDSTVVEFSYNDSLQTPEKFRWVPLRTRPDKTESVMRFKRKYGNNVNIANRVWSSIQHPITLNDIKLLGDPKTNQEHIKLLKTRISSETISMARRDDRYYQLVTNLGKTMRNFHNWIKSNIIYTYCSKKTLLDSSKVIMDVLDIGVGRGGDLMKLYHAKVKSAVCIDVNEANIFSGSDGAISRYNVMKKKMPGFPKMSFVVANGGQKFDFENQSKLGKMNNQNVKLLKQIFGDNMKSQKFYTFDVFNVQFVIHYLLQNTETWNNFCYNVNKYLRQDGYLLISTLDGQMVNNAFVDGHVTKSYITEDGNKELLFDIIKKYPENSLSKSLTEETNLGKQIDVHLPIFMEEGTYVPEYLVNPPFLINELKTKCNMRLIETESFQNLYYVYEDFFKNTANFESKAETRKFFNDVKQFYDQNNELNKSWFEYSKMNRYYIFQKL